MRPPSMAELAAHERLIGCPVEVAKTSGERLVGTLRRLSPVSVFIERGPEMVEIDFTSMCGLDPMPGSVGEELNPRR